MSWLQQFPETERPKAEEALKLYKDAQEMLRTLFWTKSGKCQRQLWYFPGYAKDDDIFIRNNNETIVTYASSTTSCHRRILLLAGRFVAPENIIWVFLPPPFRVWKLMPKHLTTKMTCITPFGKNAFHRLAGCRMVAP